MPDYTAVARHYLVACVWADCPEGTHPRPSKQAQVSALATVKAFIDSYLDLYWQAMACPGYGSHPDAGSPEAAFGHDLYLSTSGHGCGFFDRTELPETLRNALQAAARKSRHPDPWFWRGWLHLS